MPNFAGEVDSAEEDFLAKESHASIAATCCARARRVALHVRQPRWRSLLGALRTTDRPHSAVGPRWVELDRESEGALLGAQSTPCREVFRKGIYASPAAALNTIHCQSQFLPLDKKMLLMGYHSSPKGLASTSDHGFTSKRGQQLMTKLR